MSSIAARLPHGRINPASSRFWLTALFLLFCYILLSWRAVLLSDAAPIISERRILVLLLGAALFWFALERLDSHRRITLARTASWIVGGTAVILSARVAVDWMMPAAPLTLSYQLRWSLAWGGYFGLWVMGAITFRRRQARRAAVEQSTALAQAPTMPQQAASSLDELNWLLDVLSLELLDLAPTARSELAERVLAKAGRYEVADDLEPLSADHNRRVRLARRLASRLQAR